MSINYYWIQFKLFFHTNDTPLMLSLKSALSLPSTNHLLSRYIGDKLVTQSAWCIITHNDLWLYIPKMWDAGLGGSVHSTWKSVSNVAFIQHLSLGDPFRILKCKILTTLRQLSWDPELTFKKKFSFMLSNQWWNLMISLLTNPSLLAPTATVWVKARSV